MEFNLCEDTSSLSKTDTANSKTASFSIQSAKLVNVFPFVVSLWVIIIIFKILNKALRKEKRSMYRIKRNWIFHLPSKPTQFLKQIESLSVIWYKNNLQKVKYNLFYDIRQHRPCEGHFAFPEPQREKLQTFDWNKPPLYYGLTDPGFGPDIRVLLF